MTSAVRAGLLAALVAVSASSCGGGGDGYSPPPAPPTSPPGSPPSSPPSGPNAPPSFTSPAAVTVRENAIGVVYRPVATDPENAALTYGATIGGLDGARFTMNPVTREIRFTAQPDFESPADAGGNNVYDISFTVSDGTNNVTQNVAITVTNTGAGFRVRRVASGMSAPIYAAGLPDGTGRIVVVERGGRIRVLNPATGVFEATDFLSLPAGSVDTGGEKGLLSIAFSPNFVSDRTFYIQLHTTSANVSEIRKYQTLANNLAQADAATADTILTVPQPSATNHKGGTVMFDNAGRLLISLGDGGNTPETAQDTSSLRGKLLRIDPSTDAFPADASRDYSIPSANPFFASGGGQPEILAMGLRNPFRISVDRVTGDILIGDVGENAIEEVDRLPANPSGLTNYGWNLREGSQPNNGGANSPSFTLPVTEYGTGGGTTQGDSITGGVVYRGPVDGLQGQYFFADFISNNQWTIPLSSLVVGSVQPASSYTRRNAEFTPDAGSVNSVVAFGTDNDGNVYIVDIGGEVFVIEPTP
jgi:glucose/arabinose dehydrogenase